MAEAYRAIGRQGPYNPEERERDRGLREALFRTAKALDKLLQGAGSVQRLVEFRC